jgi:hypothetical protein
MSAVSFMTAAEEDSLTSDQAAGLMRTALAMAEGAAVEALEDGPDSPKRQASVAHSFQQ